MRPLFMSLTSLMSISFAYMSSLGVAANAMPYRTGQPLCLVLCVFCNKFRFFLLMHGCQCGFTPSTRGRAIQHKILLSFSCFSPPTHGTLLASRIVRREQCGYMRTTQHIYMGEWMVLDAGTCVLTIILLNFSCSLQRDSLNFVNQCCSGSCIDSDRFW